MYFELFGRDQIMIIRSEDLFTDSSRVIGDVLRFLGLPLFMIEPAYDELFRNENFYSKRMKDETRIFLADYFRPYNERLYELLGVDMGWEAALRERVEYV